MNGSGESLEKIVNHFYVLLLFLLKEGMCRFIKGRAAAAAEGLLR